MTIEIRVPELGESVTEATIGKWFKSPGETFARDEPLVELETDKVTIEVPAPVAGIIDEVLVGEGETVEVGALLGTISENDRGAARPEDGRKAAEEPEPEKAKAPAGKAAAPATMPLSPAVRKLVAEHDLDPATITGTGKGGRLTKADVLAAIESRTAESTAEETRTAGPASEPAPEARPASPASPMTPAPTPAALRVAPPHEDEAREERVRMTRLRQTIARRLKDAQNTAAMLTTFNEADMTAVMATRKAYRDLFERKHGVRLGFMGFFVKACIQALKEIPAVNGEIDGEDLIYKNYYHIGVAVGTERGLVVPVLRDADRMSIADIETKIRDFGTRARDGRIAIDEMTGGTFTISNGGVYGSLMSTPILNAPQSGILGMHKIQQRPMVVDGEIRIRPMMYLALSYDHRIVDGREAVTFLVRVKECLEDPQRLVLDL